MSNLTILAYRMVCDWPTGYTVTIYSGIGSDDLSSTEFILNPSTNFEEQVRLLRRINTPSPSHTSFTVTMQRRMKISHLIAASRNSAQ